MQVHNISNSQSSKQNFQGKINIIPGDLSYLPAKYVRKAYSSMEKQIKDKPFDLFIKQNHKENKVGITAQREKDIHNKNALKSEVFVASDADVYESAAAHVINEFETKLQKQPETFITKAKKAAGNIWHFALRALEIED